MKICEVCSKEKDENEFPILKKDENGIALSHRSLCKPCYANKRSNNTAYKEKFNAQERLKTAQKLALKEETHGLRTCVKCNNQKTLDETNFSPIVRTIKEKTYINYRKECRVCFNELRRGDEDYKEYSKKYKRKPEVMEKHNTRRRTEESKIVARKRDKERKQTDILYRIKKNLRSRTRTAMLRADFVKEQNLVEYLGCTPIFFKNYIESYFEPWMNWDNYGTHPYENWSIDHTVALKKAQNVQELHELCHYTNCRPMLVVDNTKKGAK